MNEAENEPKTEESNQGFFSTSLGAKILLVWDFVKIVVVALIIIIPIRYFVFQPFIVSGSSMEPNFQNGQYLIIDELSYRFSDPQRGQIVVLVHHTSSDPKLDKKEFYIKRIVGLPGETVKIDNGHVIIFNSDHPEGVTLTEPYLPNQELSYPHDSNVIGGKKILTLAADQYFMMGDNRLASSDSRDWGILPRSDMVGKVFIRVLPLSVFDVYNQVPAYSF